jgi:hypothetical protein
MRENRDYTASMLSPPFSIIAERAGLRSLGLAVDLLGPYQAIGGFVLRSWAEANRALLERYIGAYVEGLRWALTPLNREEAVTLLVDRLELAPDVAVATYLRRSIRPEASLPMPCLTSTGSGPSSPSELSWGYRGGGTPATGRYYDPQYYERALAALNGGAAASPVARS